MDQKKALFSASPLVLECMQHATFAQQKVDSFYGREGLLQQIKDHIIDNQRYDSGVMEMSTKFPQKFCFEYLISKLPLETFTVEKRYILLKFVCCLGMGHRDHICNYHVLNLNTSGSVHLWCFVGNLALERRHFWRALWNFLPRG